MNIHHRFRGCAYFLVAISYCALSVCDDHPLVMILGLLATILSWFLVERPQRGMPRWLINIGVLSASVLLYSELVRNPDPNLLRALAHFMAAILACKLFERKSNRDFSQILTLSLLIVVTGAILTSSLAYGVLMAVYFALGLYIVLLFHLRTEFAAEPAVDKPANPRIRRDIRFLTLMTAGTLICVASVVFVVFPRNKGREFLSTLALNRTTAVTGFSDSVIFTDFGALHQSYAVVMEAKFVLRNGPEQLSLAPAEDYYFRGATFEHYDTNLRKWTHAFRANQGEGTIYKVNGPDDEFPLQSPDADESVANFYEEKWLMTQQITLYPAAGNTLFAAAPAVNIHDIHDLRGVVRNPRDGTLTYTGATSDHITYQIDTPQIYKPGVFQWGKDKNGEPNPLPAQDVSDIVKKYARIAAGDLAPPEGSTVPPTPQQAYKIAERMEEYLRTHYAYSLEIHTIDGNLDPVSDFLANRQSVGGHCQYFASAMVLMCRALNMEARLVTGYHGGDFNTLDNVYTVRQKDAHAWVEVMAARPEWKTEPGWVQFDPTPAVDSTPLANDSWTRWVKELLEVAERSWLATIVSFDNNTRAYLANAVVDPIIQWGMGMQALLQLAGARLVDQTFSANATFASCFKIVAPDLLVLAYLAWRTRQWFRGRNSSLRPALRNIKSRTQRRQLLEELSFFDDLMAVLRRKGERRSPSQTPREFVRSACQSVAIAEDDALWLVDRFYELRFGSTAISPQLRTDISARLTRLRIAIKHA